MSLTGKENVRFFPFLCVSPFEWRKCRLTFWSDVEKKNELLTLSAVGYGPVNPSTGRKMVLFESIKEDDPALKALSFFGGNVILGAICEFNAQRHDRGSIKYYWLALHSWWNRMRIGKNSRFTLVMEYGDYELTLIEERLNLAKGLRQLLYNRSS